MIETHLSRVLVATAAIMMFAPGAAAESPQEPRPPSTAAAANTPGPAQGASQAKGDAKGDKGDEKGDKGDKGDKEKSTSERTARRDAQHAAQRAELTAALHAPVSDSIRDQLRVHAQRVAKLERIKAVALEAKDKDSADRAAKLLDKETARYQKWMAQASSPDKPATTDTKGGAQ
jgi:hypothetical protein